MSRPSKNDSRILGPYADRERWYLLEIDANGQRRKQMFATKEAADEALRALSATDTTPTLLHAMIDYLHYLERKGCKTESIKTSRYRLNAFFGFDQPDGGLADLTVAKLTPVQCAALYEAQTRKTKVDTHRNTLNLAKTFGRWCVKQGWVGTSPVEAIEPIGRRKRGKEQLRIDEARKFLTTCESFAREGDAGATAAMTLLLLGMRASEVVERVVRDLDDAGRVLWIPKAKTEAGKRTLEVPPSLRGHLQQLARGKRPTDRIFSTKGRQWVLYHVRRMCKLAGVPVVSAHSLRGLHATLATEHGSTGRIVASALGHTSFDAVTKRHYVAPGTTERVAQRRVSEVLGGDAAAVADVVAGNDGETVVAMPTRRKARVPAAERNRNSFRSSVASPTVSDPESRTAG